MSNLLKGRSASHKASYEGFDLSHSVNFTSSVGQLIPIVTDLLLPDDKIQLKTDILTRLQPMASASPVPIREHVDFYFVPLECLYTLFPSLLSDTNEDVKSNLFNKSNFTDKFPVCSLYATYNSVVNTYTQFQKDDVQGFAPYQFGFARLLDAFHYGYVRNSGLSPFVFNGGNSDPANVFVNVLAFQAYQAVWQYFFRDDKRIEFDRASFNVDDFYNSIYFGLDGSQITGSQFDRFEGMFSLRYRMKKKDPYTITSPSPLGGSSSLNHFGSGANGNTQFTTFLKQWLSDVGGNAIVPEVVGSSGQNPNTNVNYTDVGFSNRSQSYAVQQSLQQHRMAQAIEKLSSIWQQSGKNYKDIMSNLFGSNGVQEDWSKPIYIGSNHADIQIDPLVAPITSGTGSPTSGTFESYTEAGQVTGSGVGANNKNDVLTFHAKTHGIFIGLYSCVPEVVYRENGIDEFHNYKSRKDFPNPVTDELGEQPIFDYNVFTSTSYVPGSPSILGWRPRFTELKLKTNRAFGSFGASLAYWLPSEWQANVNTVKFYYIDPRMLNPIMMTQYGSMFNDPQGVPNDIFQEDPLLHFFYLTYHKASRMSSFGVPSTYFG